MPKETGGQTAQGPKMVSISEDYLTFLHDQLAENQFKLREVFGDSSADALFCWSADKLVLTVEGNNYSFDPLEGVLQKIRGWGMKISRKDDGEVSQLEVKCPYAETVHPRLSTDHPKCPLGEYILGAVRLRESKSVMLSNDLTGDGVRFRIGKSE